MQHFEIFILFSMLHNSSPWKMKREKLTFYFFLWFRKVVNKNPPTVPTHLVFLNPVICMDMLNQGFSIWTILSALFLPNQNWDYKRQHGSTSFFLKFLKKWCIAITVVISLYSWVFNRAHAQETKKYGYCSTHVF